MKKTLTLLMIGLFPILVAFKSPPRTVQSLDEQQWVDSRI